MKKIIYSLTVLISLAFYSYGQDKPNKAPDPIAPYSKAIMAQGFLFISGQIGLEPGSTEIKKGEFSEEVDQVMKNLQAVLEEHGLNFNQLVKCTVYLTDMNNFSVFNDVYARYFPDARYPARETVQVVKLPKNARIEISAIAAP